MNKYQRTSTNCLYFLERKGRKKRLLMAFYDSSIPSENVAVK